MRPYRPKRMAGREGGDLVDNIGHRTNVMCVFVCLCLDVCMQGWRVGMRGICVR